MSRWYVPHHSTTTILYFRSTGHFLLLHFSDSGFHKSHKLTQAFRIVTGLPTVLIKSASKTLQAGSKKLQEGLAEAKGRLSSSGDSFIFQPRHSNRLFHRQLSNASSQSSFNSIDEHNQHTSFGNSFRSRIPSLGHHSMSTDSISKQQQLKNRSNRSLCNQTSNTPDQSDSRSAGHNENQHPKGFGGRIIDFLPAFLVKTGLVTHFAPLWEIKVSYQKILVFDHHCLFIFLYHSSTIIPIVTFSKNYRRFVKTCTSLK